jgi:hypothetical protein
MSAGGATGLITAVSYPKVRIVAVNRVKPRICNLQQETLMMTFRR